MVSRKILSILAILWVNFTYSQSNNFWNVIDYNAITFQNNIPVVTNQSLRGTTTASICNSKGKVVLYSDFSEVYDGNHILITNGNLTPYCIIASLFIALNDSTYYLLQKNQENTDTNVNTTCRTTGGLLYSIIRLKNDKFSINASEKQLILKRGIIGNDNVWSIAVTRNEKGKYYLDESINDTALIFSIDTAIILKSVFPLINFFSLSPCANSADCKLFQRTKLIFDHIGNRLYATLDEDLNATILLGKKVDIGIGRSYKVIRFDFDKNSGIITNPVIILKNLNYFTAFPNIKLNDVFDWVSLDPNAIFSIDDKFMYINEYKNHQILNINGKGYSQKDTSVLIQVDVDNGNRINISLSNKSLPPKLLKQAPDGRIFNYYIEKISGILYFRSDVIQLPEKNGLACLYQQNVDKLPLLKPINFNVYQTSYHLHDYLRLDFKVTYDCKANIQFVNNSFSEAQFSDYTWYINKLNGKTDTLYGNAPSITIGKSGKYPYKVFGHSPSKHYGEWFYDTLYIDIPEKPVANFNTKDSIVCRYLPVHFNNLSHTKDINPNSTVKYVWTFGDGGPSSNVFEPSHTFTQPGYYTVSLFYSNGYCDSTLVKNQYIHVVDAPKPGFTVAKRQGCSPFTAQFIDTVSLNITKKEYLFTDSLLWKPISSPKFNYTFAKPGHYWAVQKLYGYTGCIIRTDSVQVFVSKGLLTSDSIRIVSASYNLDNILRLDWQPNMAATNYQVYKSVNGTTFLPLVQTKDTFSFDKSIPSNVIYYKVKGIDSCGSFSSSYNIVSPAFISGNTVNGNEAAQINHYLQQGLGIPLKIELLGSFDTKSQFNLTKFNPANPFNDNDFARQDYLRKCYRLSSSFAALEMYSNTFCMDYVPVVYIPNSFTPDGNGLNDKFGPLAYGIESYTITIYNNWGEILYTGSKPWDGRYKEEVVMDGVYFYQVSLIENSHNLIYKKGIIHVLK